MRSKVAKKIQNKTSDEVRKSVRQYTDITISKIVSDQPSNRGQDTQYVEIDYPICRIT